MKKKTQKTKRDFSQPQAEEKTNNFQAITEFKGFKIDEKVWFKSSLVLNRYSYGLIKEISKGLNEEVSFSVWDDVNGMWRQLRAESLLREKPARKRRSKKNIECN
jgi:hypothetical protein